MGNTKIFLIIPTLNQGGAERVLSELANEFVNYRNVSIHLILLTKSADFYKLDERVIIHRLGFQNPGHISKIKHEVITFLKLRKLFKLHKPDVILSFMSKYNIFTLLAGSFLGLRIFVSDRSNPKLKDKLYIEILRKLTYRNATGIIAQTNLAKKIIQNNTKNCNIKVIPNPIRNIRLYPDIERQKVILNVGRLVPEKGQHYLLDAFAKLNLHDWKLVILGDGPLRNKLEYQSRKLGIEKQLIMPGSVNNVDEWFAKSSIFVFPSISEGFPNALMEAMAAGLPCISFNCDAGPSDIIINGKNGILLDRFDSLLLANTIKDLIFNNKLLDHIASNATQLSVNLNKVHIAKIYFEFLTSQHTADY